MKGKKEVKKSPYKEVKSYTEISNLSPEHADEYD